MDFHNSTVGLPPPEDVESVQIRKGMFMSQSSSSFVSIDIAIMPSSTLAQFKRNAATISPLLAITSTTLLSALLFWIKDLRSIGPFYDFCMSNSSTVSFFKQIIAGLLSALWIYVIVTLFNYTTRVRFASNERRPTLHTLNLWAALSVQRVDFSLRLPYLLLTVVVILAAHTVGSLWAGAIAVIPAKFTYENNTVIAVPNYPSDPLWSSIEFPMKNSPTDFNDDLSETCQERTGEFGYITSCPVPSEFESDL